MERRMYQPTESQEQKWARHAAPAMPTDDEFKAMWKKSHHGKVTGWGMGKREWIVSQMKFSREYQIGIWQGRVDRAQGLDYSEERSENVYNLGYYRGYTSYESDIRGMDAETRQRFAAEYANS